MTTAVADLTPQRPVSMGGRVGPHRTTRFSHGRLEANVLSLGEGPDAVVLVSLDTLFVGAALTKRIVAVSAERFGVEADRVLVLASHTHTAPMLDASKPLLGKTDPDEVDRWGAAVEAGILAAPKQVAAFTRVGVGLSERAVNRRLHWPYPNLKRLLRKVDGDIYMCDNPNGRWDRRIRTCVWFSPTGEPLAVLWSFACHPVSFPELETASADYVGVVRDAIRLRLQHNLPVIFAPGCMGDVRPRSAVPWNSAARIPRLIIHGPSLVPFSREAWDDWATGLAAEVNAIDDASVTRPIGVTSKASAMARLPLSSIFSGSSPTPELHAKAVSVPGLGRMVALTCEPVAAIADSFSTSDEDLVVGYEGDVFGYLPTESMVAEGGYEARNSHAAFGLVGSFRPGLDDAVSQLGRALAL